MRQSLLLVRRLDQVGQLDQRRPTVHLAPPNRHLLLLENHTESMGRGRSIVIHPWVHDHVSVGPPGGAPRHARHTDTSPWTHEG